jgi:hypothetical protein
MTARKTDPWTSHAAAGEDPGPRSTVRSRVLGLLTAAPEARDGITHDGIITLYRKYQMRLGWPPATDSSIRTRVSELVEAGLVEAIPDAAGKSRYGRAALLWRAVAGDR